MNNIIKDAATENEITSDIKKPHMPKHVKVALQLVNNARVCDHNLFLYVNDSYTSDEDMIKRGIIEKWPYAKSNDLKEVTDRLRMIAERTDGPSPDYIAFANGLLSVSDWKMYGHTPDIFTTNKIPHKLIPLEEIPCEVRKRVDMFLEAFSDGKNDRLLTIQEIMGLCLLSDTITNTIFVLIGDGNNGKTVFLKTLKTLLGKDNCTSQNLSQLTSRFGTCWTYGKLAILSDETIDDGANIEILKQLSGGSTISAEVKYAPTPIAYTSYATVIIAGNRLPRFSFYGKAEKNRFVYIEFSHDFTAEKAAGSDDDIKALLSDELAMSYMLHFAVEGLKRVIENRTITKTADQERLQHEHECESNPIVSFIDESGGPDTFIGMPVSEVWEQFKSYMSTCFPDRKDTDSTIKTFGKSFRAATSLRCDTKRLSGKLTKVYIR